MPKNEYTDREGCKDLQRIEEYNQAYNTGDMMLDEWIMALFTLATQMREKRVSFLWAGLYTMGEQTPEGLKL